MVDAREPPSRPRKGTGKPRPATTPKPVKAAPVAEPADPLMDELSRDLNAAGKEAFNALRSIGLGHVSPTILLDRLSLIIGKEIQAVIDDHRNNDPNCHVRYGILKQVLADLRDGKPVVLPFGVPRAARIAPRAAPVAPGAPAAQATVANVLKQMAALDKPSPATASGSTSSYRINYGGPGKATGYNPRTAPPRKPDVDKGQSAKPGSPPETQADGGAGGVPPAPPPGPPAGRSAGPEKRPDMVPALVTPRQPVSLADRVAAWADRAREALIRHRRVIARATLYVVVLSVLGMVFVGAANFGAIVSGVSGGIFSVLTTWMSYRLAAGLGAILMLLWLMELTPTEYVAPPRNAWLPAILCLFCVVYAAGGTEVVGSIINGALNTPLDSFTLKALAAMAALSLAGVFFVRWQGAFPDDIEEPTISFPRDWAEPQPAGYGRYGRRAFMEKEPFGDPGIGRDSEGDDIDRLKDVMSGKRGFFRPKFKD